MTNSGTKVPKPLWAYAYEIIPPKTVDHLKEMESLLDDLHRNAKKKEHSWRGQLICEEHVTHILIVSDTPDQGTDVNRKIERRLNRLKAGFSRSTPMPVPSRDDTDA